MGSSGTPLSSYKPLIVSKGFMQSCTLTSFLLEWAYSNNCLFAVVTSTVGRCFTREAERSICRPRSG